VLPFKIFAYAFLYIIQYAVKGRFMKYIHVALMAGLLSGCLDSGSDDSSTKTGSNNPDGAYSGPDPTLTGLFKDTKTTGLDYKVGQYTGRTDELGAFKYFSEDDDITFSVGGVVLGTVKVSQVLTPIDLFVDGTSEKIDVQNIVSFLLALDDDADPSNGINITEAQAEEAKSWSQLDFSSTDFETDVATIDENLTLPTSTEAREHIEATYKCMYSGLWRGEYGGIASEQGENFRLTDANTGVSHSGVYSTTVPTLKIISETSAITYESDMLIAEGNASNGTSIESTFPNIVESVGTWTTSLAPGSVGTVSSDRFNKDLEYQNRITAVLSDSEIGYSQNTKYFVAIDIKDSGEYKAAVYTFNEELSNATTVSSRIAEDYTSTGSLISGSASFTLAGINKKISFTTDFSTNTVSLTSDSDVAIDSVSGGSCKLL
jgi:hypothetical protein